MCGGEHTEILSSEKVEKQIAKLVKIADQVLKQVHKGDLKTGMTHGETVEIQLNILVSAVDQELSWLNTRPADGSDITDDQKLYQTIRNNCFRFSVAKNYQEIKSISAELTDHQGRIRSFEEFSKAAKAVCSTYRGDWMRTEYNQSLVTSTRINDYVRHEQLGKAYPTRQYMTRADGHVRDAHAALHRLKFAADDPALSIIYPPNGWNCRCYIKPLTEDAPKHEAGQAALSTLTASGELERMKKAGYNTNPGQTGVIFPPEHPYWNGIPESVFAK